MAFGLGCQDLARGPGHAHSPLRALGLTDAQGYRILGSRLFWNLGLGLVSSPVSCPLQPAGAGALRLHLLSLGAEESPRQGSGTSLSAPTEEPSPGIYQVASREQGLVLAVVMVTCWPCRQQSAVAKHRTGIRNLGFSYWSRRAGPQHLKAKKKSLGFLSRWNVLSS